MTLFSIDSHLILEGCASKCQRKGRSIKADTTFWLHSKLPFIWRRDRQWRGEFTRCYNKQRYVKLWAFEKRLYLNGSQTRWNKNVIATANMQKYLPLFKWAWLYLHGSHALGISKGNSRNFLSPFIGCKNCFWNKGGLFSESFSFRLQSPQKGAKSLKFWAVQRKDAQDSVYH